MSPRPRKKHGNNPGVNFKQLIFLECSVQCSLEVKEEESCDSKGIERLKKSEAA